MMTENSNIPDLWTDSSYYADLYQNADQIREVIKLLDLGSATLLIDVGCGNGVFAVEAASRFPDCSVVAVDFLPSAVEECRRRASTVRCNNIRIEVASANTLPLADISADRVLIRNVLHHIKSIDNTFSEISRVLTDAGMLLIESPCNLGDNALGKLISDIHILMDDSHLRTYHSPEDIIASLAKNDIVASSPQYWPYRFPIGPEQIDLVRSRDAVELLLLDESSKGRASIQLTMARILGTKIKS